MRSKFGWDLPPGCTHRMIDNHWGGDDETEEEEASKEGAMAVETDCGKNEVEEASK